MNAIEAIELYKKFNNIIAVNNVSFNVKEGEIFGFLGPNGAGKTTTIRILTGLLKPEHGEAKIMGYNIHENPIKAKMMIGVVPEEANPYPDLSTWDNLILVANLYGISKNNAEGKASQLLKLLDLYEIRNRKARNLSKGMKQKLLVGMALISDPKILFLDEPTVGLDVLSARKIRNLILELKQNKTTVFLTTHNVEEAGALCDRIAIIKNGKIIALGNPEELKIKAGLYTYVTIVFDKKIDEHNAKLFFNPWEFEIKDSKLLIICNEPANLIVKAVEYAKINGLEIIDIRVSPPNLEDVFVKITGEE
ncbi:MAG: ATP-binding cassette domain-containing protein [Candidatus Aenigmatarchaeota archaeon]